MSARAGSRRISLALVLVISLYALWGMAHNLNDILIAQFRKAFTLSDLQSSLVQSCFYIAYLVAPIPVMLFLQRYGYRAGVIAGLLLYAAGALLFWPAAQSVTYGAFLGALFVIACGIVFLETAGTGIIVTLGSPERAEWRINLAQAFNPLGSIAGVLIGRQFILSGEELTAMERAAMSPAQFDAWRAAEAQAVQAPYLVIALVLLAIAALVATTRFPASATSVERGSPFDGMRAILKSRLFRFAVVAQFFYVGTQIGIWSFLILYCQEFVPGTNDRQAALYLSGSLVLFLVGRFTTLALLRRWSSAQIGRVFAAAAALLTAMGAFAPGPVGAAALVGVSFFMSIMYPGIYAIGLSGNEANSKPASALMIMAIVSGAVLTAAMGAISDASTIAFAYLVPLAGFVIVGLFFQAGIAAGRTGAALGRVAH